MAPRRGFTLPELLVAMLVISILGLLMVRVFTESEAAIDHGSKRLEVVQRTRIAADRLLPYVTSAVQFAGQEGVPFPQINLPGSWTPAFSPADAATWPQHLIFRTTEDFLSPTYDPDFALSYPNVIAEFYPTFLYVVWMEGDDTAGGELDLIPNLTDAMVLGKLSDPPNAGDQNWLMAPWANFDSSNTQNYQVLARNLVSVRFRRYNEGALVARIEARQNPRRGIGVYVNEALIQLPSYVYE